MSNILLSFVRSASFALWSIRRRTGQIIPVTVALLLLVCAVQTIGALHDISSVLTQQQIARSWRGAYDLLVRPQSAVSQIERSAEWIDPQSNLETYGGISAQQVTRIQALGHVLQVVPFATAGWQSVEILLPVALPQVGIYRISASWNGQGKTNDDTVRYVDVTDLAHLTSEVPIAYPIVQHVIAVKSTTPVIFTMSVQAIQDVIGVPLSQYTNLREELLKGIAPVPNLHLFLRVERLQGDLSTLPSCIKLGEQRNCWQSEPVLQGTASYVADGVQLIHYSRTLYSASSQQSSAGQISINSSGSDVQGPVYRFPLPDSQDTSSQANIKNLSFEQLASPSLLPFSMTEHLPLLANAVRFVPIEQVCTANAGACYSGLYVRINGVEHYSQQSLARLQAMAAAITAQTGLHVDILDGSSWRSISVKFSQSGVTLTQQSMWRVPGVAVQIVQGVDGLQEMLLVLCAIVCFLAIGAAGVLIGVGRKKDALVLRQLGWQRYQLIVVFTLDALLLCVPGCLMAVGCIALATRFWPNSLHPIVTWILPAISVILYSCLLNRAALGGVRKIRNYNAILVGSLATTSAVFLIAEGYILLSSFNSELIVTILGRQVHEALEGPQLALLVVLVSAALLTVALCTQLLLIGRREELRLLSMLGWERRTALLRIMRDSWWAALLSGGAGILLALGLAILIAALPPPLVVIVLLSGGPLLGILLVSMASLGIAWQETGRVYAWR